MHDEDVDHSQTIEIPALPAFYFVTVDFEHFGGRRREDQHIQTREK